MLNQQPNRTSELISDCFEDRGPLVLMCCIYRLLCYCNHIYFYFDLPVDFLLLVDWFGTRILDSNLLH